MNRLLRACAFLVVLSVVGAVVTVNQVRQMLLRTPKDDAPIVAFEVKEGEGFVEIARRLRDEELIQSAFWFRVAAEFAGLTEDIKPGTHDVQKGMNYGDILAIMTQPDTNEVTITIPEGYTLKQIGEVVQSKLSITADDWSRVTGINSPFEAHPFVVDAEKPDNVDLEGYLFPDTYRFFEDATAEDVVEKMLNTMQQKVTYLDEPTGDSAGMTTHEILTLASIIEREVRKPAEMKNVADIFLKRLEIGMALQADSTVNYVTGGGDPSISLVETDLDSPYNTYKYPGLPPGPISNPGVNALTAVIHPAENAYFYFLTDDLGNVYYAKTFEEHVANKARYLD